MNHYSSGRALAEGNFHATAVETGKHLRLCFAYIDLNAVREGIVKHPAYRPFCGYQEIDGGRFQDGRSLIDKPILMRLLGAGDEDRLRGLYRGLIEEALRAGELPL